MKQCAECFSVKARELFSNSSSSKDGKYRICKECDKAAGARRYAANKEKKKASAKEWHAKNPERVKEIKAKYKAKNRQRLNDAEAERQRLKRIAEPEKYKAKDAKRRAENPEQVRVLMARWRKNNVAHRTAYSVEKRAARDMATPKWANRFFIDEAYDLAIRRKMATGFDWHVDHIIPLRSKVVCGLHVEGNLQVIPALMNLKKSNRFEVR